jgi:hypothetical protein
MVDQTSAKYFKVKIPKDWVHYVIDPTTFEPIFTRLRTPPIVDANLKYSDLPPCMIHPKEGGYFMFEDEIEALTFKLTYL